MRDAGNDVLHLLHLPSLRIEGDHARGWIPFQMSGVMQAPAHSRAVGVYDVVYRRTRDGWRIQQRTSKLTHHASSWVAES